MSRFDDDPVFGVISDPLTDEVPPLSDVIGDEAAARVDKALKNPETGVRREHPGRRVDPIDDELMP